MRPYRRRTLSNGLTLSEASVVVAVDAWHREHPGARVGPPLSAIAESCGVTKEAIRKTTAKLHASGFLKRRSVRTTNNSILVTKRGLKAIAE